MSVDTVLVEGILGRSLDVFKGRSLGYLFISNAVMITSPSSLGEEKVREYCIARL